MTAEPVHISSAISEVLVESLTADELFHLAALARERGRVPSPVARVLAEELGVIVSSPPLESDLGPIPNRPTIGWWRSARRRIAEAAA